MKWVLRTREPKPGGKKPVCPICKQHNRAGGAGGSKHYSCATGKPRTIIPLKEREAMSRQTERAAHRAAEIAAAEDKDRISIWDAAREVIAAANSDPNYAIVSQRLYFAIQGLEEALKLREVWGADHYETEPVGGTSAS